ncbi:MAG TPA: HD domain-containing protein [Clostridia bacterium]|nr:HD domain-containing protein [Clostridia bacterium]
MEFEIQPPQNVLYILNTLKNNGCEAYAVGGCVRDAVLGRVPKDWDITVNAAPAKVKALFDHTLDTGIKHGTVTVMLGEEAYEVTAFRVDGIYEDGRHPSSIEFTGSLEDDLRRRDFTINAMAWNSWRGLADPFGGMADLKAGCIRAVGDPDERFREDALRMLRAVRFAAQLGFEIEAGTFEGIRKNSRLIYNVSCERIREELSGILTSADPGKITLLRDSGIMGLILPEVGACFETPQNNPHHIYNVGEHSVRAAAAIESERCLRWTMLLHDTGKALTRTTDEEGVDHFHGHAVKSVEIAENILGRLKFDNKSMDRIIRLIKFHDRDIVPQPKAVAKAVCMVGEDIFTDLLKVKRADKAAQNPADADEGIGYIDSIERVYRELLEDNSCLKLKDLALNGRDLIGLGFHEGREIGRTLAALFEKVLEDPSLNDKDALSRLAVQILARN